MPSIDGPTECKDPPKKEKSTDEIIQEITGQIIYKAKKLEDPYKKMGDNSKKALLENRRS
jgi:hypothetical protein